MIKFLTLMRQNTTLKLHGKLSEKSHAYHIWHEHPYHKHLHWATFFLVILYTTSFISSTLFINVNGVQAEEPIVEDSTSTTTEDISTSTPAIDTTATTTEDTIATSTETATTTEDTSTSTPSETAQIPVNEPLDEPSQTEAEPTLLEDTISTTTEDIATSTPDTTATTTEDISTTTPDIDFQPVFIKSISSPILKGTFHSGVIPIIVIFNKAVIVTGAPKLILKTGVPSTTAVSLRFAFGNQLYFLYHIAPGNSTSLLDYNSSSAIDLNGGSIKDDYGNDVITTLPDPGSFGSLSYTSKIIIEDSLGGI